MCSSLDPGGQQINSWESLHIVRDPDRLRALHQTLLLDTPVEEAFDRLTRLATSILHVPIALVSLVDADRQFFKSCIGLSEPWASQRETPLSHSFCQHAIALNVPLLIEDARSHPLVRDNLAISDLGVVAYAGIPLTMPDGFVLGSFCIMDTKPRLWKEEEVKILQELAASVLTEIELRLATREAKEAIREREALLSIASHELKNPLTTLLAYAQLLEQQVKPGTEFTERDRQSLQMIREQGRRINTLLTVLLDTARIESGQFIIARNPVKLHRLVARVVSAVEPMHQHHSIMYHEPDTSIIVLGDEMRLEQVVHNLVGNAIKYSPHGGPITIHLTIQHGKACLRVEDQGIGIPQDSLHRLFQRFSRVHNAYSQHISGLGLGLYVVKEIISLHGGTIEVKSTEGQGSVFTVLLPLHDM
jgi:signal transduction histidine kinase